MNIARPKQLSAKWAMPVLIIFILVLIAGFCVVTLQAAQSSSNSANEIDQLRRDRIVNAVVPIGAIVPYYGDPRDMRETGCWQLCNGDPLAEGADPRLHDRMENVPDLQGCFIRGALSGYEEFSFAYGGSNISTIPTRDTVAAGDHRHRVDPHHHDLPSLTGVVTNNLNERDHLDDLNQSADWKNENNEIVGHAVAHAGAHGNEGQHMHDLGGSTANEDPHTSELGSHSHAVPETEIPIVPRHAELHYIMRIR